MKPRDNILMAIVVACAVILIASANSGCWSKPTPAPHVIVAPTGTATAAQISSQEAQIESLTQVTTEQKKLAQSASGAVYGAKDANRLNPTGLPKEAVDAQLDEAASALPEPTAEQKLEKANQNARIMAGELLAVKAEMGQKITENQALRVSLTAAEQRAQEAEKAAAEIKAAAEKERAEAAAKLQKQFDDMTKLIAAEKLKAQQAIDEARKAALQRLGWVLLGLATAFTVAGAGIAFVTKGLEWQRAAIAATFGGFCFGLYWTMNQPWFKWAVIGVIVCAVGAGIWWLLKERDSAVRSKEADEAEDTLKRIIPVLDETAPTETITKLSSAMNDSNKALVHELRAETKRAT